MSWIVQTLLRDSQKLRTPSYLNTDSYYDLLTVEKKIKELLENNEIAEKDILVLHYITEGMSLTEIKKAVGKSDVSRQFNRLCTQIATSIGGEFTDEGYLEMIQNKYHLSDRQISIVENYTKSKSKHRLVRNPKSYDDN